MYLRENGVIVSDFGQYECRNIPQVKNFINNATKTKSINDDWKDYCNEAKKTSGEITVDYTYFNEHDEEIDCSVNISYDETTRTYLVWIECD